MYLGRWYLLEEIYWEVRLQCFLAWYVFEAVSGAELIYGYGVFGCEDESLRDLLGAWVSCVVDVYCLDGVNDVEDVTPWLWVAFMTST